MVRSKILFLIFVLFFCSRFVSAQRYPDARVDSLIRSGIDDIMLQNYVKAKETFRELDLQYKNLPLGKIYLVATELAKNYDFEEPINTDFVEETLDSAENITQELLDKDDHNLWYIYFKALREGYFAYYKTRTNNWLSAFSNGVNSVRDYEKCLVLDPDFYDAYIAIGAFKYWKSRKTEVLKWLPFVKDEREEGIKYLKKAIDHSTYNNYLAINSLLWIYIDQKKYVDAINLAQKILQKYPGSRFFMMPLARAYEDVDIPKAISIYKELLTAYQDRKDSNHYNEIVLKHIIAQQYVKIGDKQQALRLCNSILASTGSLSDYVKDKLEDRLDRVRDLQKELSGR